MKIIMLYAVEKNFNTLKERPTFCPHSVEPTCRATRPNYIYTCLVNFKDIETDWPGEKFSRYTSVMLVPKTKVGEGIPIKPCPVFFTCLVKPLRPQI